MAREKDFENKVKDYLRYIGAWYLKYWAGADYTKEGIPDILACINGKFYGIEIKAEKGKPKLIQLVKLRQIRRSGGIGVLLYPKDFDGFIALTHGVDNGWYAANILKQDEWYQKLNINL
jgi:hypothetical protein